MYNGNMKKSLRIILTVVFAIIYAAIFAYMIYQSSMTGEESMEESGKITKFLATLPPFAPLASSGQLEDVVRKFIGHFCEYGFLGIIGYFLFSFAIPKTYDQTVNLASGFLCATVTEVIQIFSVERGPSFADIILDFQGYLTAYLGLTLILFLIGVKYIKSVNLIVKRLIFTLPFFLLAITPFIFFKDLSLGNVMCYYVFLAAFAFCLTPVVIITLIKRKTA